MIEAPVFAPNHLSADGPRSAPVPDDEAARIRALLRDGWGRTAHDVRRFATGGTTAASYLLDERWVLKVRAEGTALARETARMRRAIAADIPVPNHHPARDGGDIHSAGAVDATLFDFVGGTHFCGADGELRQAAAVFAAFARAFADETQAAARDWAGIGASLRAALDLSPKVADPAAEEALSAKMEYLSAALRDDAGRRLDAVAAIHTDLHPLNLLFANGRIAAVLDFEDVAAAPRAVGAGFALLKLGREALSRAPATNRRAVACDLIAQWRAVDPTPTDLLASGARRRVLANVAEILEAWRARGDTTMNHGLPGQLESLAEIDYLFEVSV